MLRMPERTAQDYFARFRNGEEYLPSQRNKKVKGPNPMLTNEHTKILQEFYDNDPTATIKQAQEMVWNKFSIAITQSGLQKHLVARCGLTMKKLESISEARNSQKTITARMQWVLKVEEEKIDFESCVFIDESGFNFHMRRTFGRSRRGTPAKIVVSNNRGVNLTILGAIASEGVVNLSLRRPQAVTGSKKRKLDAKEERIVAKVGTRTEHFLDFLEIVMDVLGKNNMHGKILIMDNAKIHHTILVQKAVEKRGYRILYLPAYSPFLNPIELFWSKLKAGIRRELLTKDDTLTPHIIESTKLVSAKDCRGWITHSRSSFPRCLLNEEKL